MLAIFTYHRLFLKTVLCRSVAGLGNILGVLSEKSLLFVCARACVRMCVTLSKNEDYAHLKKKFEFYFNLRSEGCVCILPGITMTTMMMTTITTEISNDWQSLSLGRTVPCIVKAQVRNVFRCVWLVLIQCCYFETRNL